MSELNPDPYAVRIRRAVDYMESHLEGDLSVERLSEVAGLSKFHFHRVFSVYSGTSVAKLVRLLRLKRATWELAFLKDKKVIDVALGAGFSNPETFCRAFRALHEQSPTEFRAAPKWRDWTHLLSVPKKDLEIEMDPKVIIFSETPIAVLEHRAPPSDVMLSVSKFIDWRKASTCSPEGDSRTFGIIYDDPDNTPPEEFKFDICGELKGTLRGNDVGVVEKVIPTGRCAVVRHEGTLDTIGPVVRKMYSSWLSTSGESLRDFPCFFHYVKRMPYVSEHEQITDIYLPIE